MDTGHRVDPKRGPRGNRTRTYRAWECMRARCRCKTNSSYHRYGGRGITVCQEWSSFERFLEDMGQAPLGCSLDRTNNDKNYSKENCRWATPIQQSQNTRKIRSITFNGKTHCLREWARRIGIWDNALRARLKHGWPLERALAP